MSINNNYENKKKDYDQCSANSAVIVTYFNNDFDSFINDNNSSLGYSFNITSNFFGNNDYDSLNFNNNIDVLVRNNKYINFEFLSEEK